MKRTFLIFLTVALCSVGLSVFGDQVIYDFQGVFTGVALGIPPMNVGDPFHVTFTYDLPGTELSSPGLSTYNFSSASATALLGSISFSASSNVTMNLWEPPVDSDTISMDATSGGLYVRPVLASSDTTVINTHVIPLNLNLAQFDLRRELQVFGPYSIIGRIDSVSVTFVPEPGAIPLAGSGALLFLAAIARRRKT